MLLPLIFSMLPVGLFGGAVFPVGCRALLTRSKDSVGRVYLIEGLGGFDGGILTAVVFGQHIGCLTLAMFFATVGFGSMLSLLFKRFKIWLIPLFAIGIAILLAAPIRVLELRLFGGLRPGLDLLTLLETPYGTLEITDREGQKTIYENGLLLATTDDLATDEERAHIPLAQHPSPQQVLWIGGYLGGGIEEALRHPSIKRLDVVELNPVLFELGRVFDTQASTRPIVNIIKGDGRTFLARAAAGGYDVIQLNLPGPQSARLAKYYTSEAFELISHALKPDGVLCFSIKSTEDYIGGDLAELLASLNSTCLMVFDSVFVLPGENAIFVAGSTGIDPASTAKKIKARLEERGIEPLYWDYYRLRSRFSTERVASLRILLRKNTTATINTDRKPISFYFQEVFKSQQVRGGTSTLLKRGRGAFIPVSLLILSLVILGVAGIRIISRRSLDEWGAGSAVFFVGFSGISLEILALVAFQVYYGSGYRMLGLLTGCYMVGLAIGAFASGYYFQKIRFAFRIMQCIWVILPLGLVLLSFLFSALETIPAVIGGILFFGYVLLVGVMGGIHFPLAVNYSGASSPIKGGMYYGIDLAGSAGSALILAIFALPLLGIWNSCYLLAAVNLIPLILLVRKESS
jgi:spermidine synthase